MESRKRNTTGQEYIQEFEQIPPEQMASIEVLLPRYYEAREQTGRYQILRSMPIAGHDVAWMSYTQEVSHPTLNGEYKKEIVESCSVGCACDFTEGVGWVEDPKYGIVSRGRNEKCVYKQTALHMRQLELRAEYREQFDIYSTEFLAEIIMDLIERDKRKEFIGEGGGGAHAWGGHFYLMTAAHIAERDMKSAWSIAERMVEEKKIQLEGSVVQEYRTPPEPSWVKFDAKIFRCKPYGDISIVMRLPSHGAMPQTWQYSVLDAAGEVLLDNIPGAAFTHEPIFGVDVEDVATAQREVDALAELVRVKQAEGSLTSSDMIQGDTSRNTDVE